MRGGIGSKGGPMERKEDPAMIFLTLTNIESI